ncbi:glycosyltransferase [Polaromonas sp. YR568]|uniref:glycosyltransferase n=1 Tax=Polaromonas sp. YR568 TaxID=1855301 RepID=UPI0031378835
MSAPLTVWVLQTGEPLPTDSGNPRPMRAMNLAKTLVAAGHKVVLWSSSFYHQEKRHRAAGNDRLTVSPLLEVRLIASPGYQRNIGPGRLWDHAVLGRNLAKLLAAETTQPDVAFVGYPPIETAAVMTRWLAERHVPCMVDVKDQWPTIFTDPLPGFLRPVGRIALAPYFHYGRRALRDATALSAMADGFLQWAAGFAGRAVHEMDRVVPLTAPSGEVSSAELAEAGLWWDALGVRNDGGQRICFIGSHSSAFDMGPVFEAARLTAAAGNSCQFVLCGEGQHTADWRRKAMDLPNVCFPGWIDRAKIEALALRSTAALAPYRNSDDFMMSIPNKVVDSLALGLPVLSPLRGEVRQLISASSVGVSYGDGSGETLAECIARLKHEPGLRDRLAANALNLFRARFSFDTVYGGLVRHLEIMAHRARQS